MSMTDDLRNKRARENILELQNRAEGQDRINRDLKRRLERVEEEIHSIKQLLEERPQA